MQGHSDPRMLRLGRRDPGGKTRMHRLCFKGVRRVFGRGQAKAVLEDRGLAAKVGRAHWQAETATGGGSATPLSLTTQVRV